MKSKLLTLTTLIIAASVACGSILIDFGVTSPGNLVGPGHTGQTAGATIPADQTTWTNASGSDNGNLSDLAAGSVLNADGSGAVAGVSVNFGVGSATLIDYSSQPFVRVGISGGRSGTGVFANGTYADFMAASNTNTAPTTVGMAISGLAAGDYAVWVIARHTYQNNDSMAPDDFDVWVGGGNTSTAPNTLTTAAIQQYNRINALANTDSWAVGEGYTWVKLTTTLTTGQDLLIFSESTLDNQNGIMNAVQIAAVPEPAAIALAIGLLAFAGALLRRRLRQ